SLVLRGARYKDEILEIGDLAIHDEEAFPDEPLAHRVGGGGPGAGAFALAGLGARRDTAPLPPPPPAETTD
ncbi:MAG TPA: hypothetical protein VNF50_00825, partial [Acidimicrobiales bacterium]|nr:hypothetical protein [Acidimicrobiales bacterium]